MNKDGILLTGANGYLGLCLSRRLLTQSDSILHLCLRACDKATFEQKSSMILSRFAGFEKRLFFYPVELSQTNPFAAVNPAAITRIIHAAAVTRFNVEADLASEINIKGTEKILDFARSCPHLSKFLLLSSVYAAGLCTGTVLEKRLEGSSGFANYYESSKWQAEEELFSHYGDLPWNVLRIATIIADDEHGRVTQLNAVHNTLKLLYYGLLSLFPGRQETPVYFVTAEFVEAATLAVIERSELRQIYHLCHQSQESAKLGELLDVVLQTFASYADFRNRRVLKPLWSDQESFQLLSEGVAQLAAGSVVNQAVSSVAPFAKQLFAGKDFRNDNLLSIMPDYRPADPLVLIENMSNYLAGTKWGRSVPYAS
ncbi:MAG: SDR family oxidoreductase [Candidatus Obscuribacterales bacterium]|nr:SDR family oxidoreductase [Candidatus Obscuribacterales bacterium]